MYPSHIGRSIYICRWGVYHCSDCGVMLFWSTCNTFWHTNNPQRTGHKGTITGCEKDENDTWKYKITFSDGEFTYACKSDPEVRFPNHHD